MRKLLKFAVLGLAFITTSSYAQFSDWTYIGTAEDGSVHYIKPTVGINTHTAAFLVDNVDFASIPSIRSYVEIIRANCKDGSIVTLKSTDFSGRMGTGKVISNFDNTLPNTQYRYPLPRSVAEIKFKALCRDEILF